MSKKKPESSAQPMGYEEAKLIAAAIIVAERGNEPYWMQDVRIAQRRIESQRIALRSQQNSGPPTDEDSGS